MFLLMGDSRRAGSMEMEEELSELSSFVKVVMLADE